MADLSKDKNYISGIYNYCDRWCERCPQTSRCLNYSIAEEEFDDPEARDINNEAFWKKISGILQDALTMIAEHAAELGLDLDELDVDDTESRSTRETAESHEISRAAMLYGNLTEAWFDKTAPLFGDGVVNEQDSNLSDGDIKDDLRDALEVVRWYQHQIYVKLMRALSGRIEERFDPPEELDGFAKDSDGSAKVALIGIDRSLASWKIIKGRLPDEEIRRIMNHLHMLRSRVGKDFPEARSFIRPGFDHFDLNS